METTGRRVNDSTQESTPRRVLSGLMLARDRREEFVRMAEPDGRYLAPSRTREHKTHEVGPMGSYCLCPDAALGRFRCAHRVAVLALETARRETKGRAESYERGMRMDHLLDLMVRLEAPMPAWASLRWIEVRCTEMADEAHALVGVTARMREELAGAALARRDMAWMEAR